jgi:hypothetical protein
MDGSNVNLLLFLLAIHSHIHAWYVHSHHRAGANSLMATGHNNGHSFKKDTYQSILTLYRTSLVVISGQLL